MNEQDRARDAGMTLIEVLVAMVLFGLFSSLLLGLALAVSRAGDDIRSRATVGEEARLGMERMTRELRQASAISAVTLPHAGSDETLLTAMVDLDGDGCIALSAPDPADVERITYTWNPDSDELLVQVSGFDSPLLATKVTEFDLELDSSSWRYDGALGGVPDGTTTWQEIDASAIGDHNQNNFTSVELANIDLIRLTITTADGGHELQYTTRVDLRNQRPNESPTPCA